MCGATSSPQFCAEPTQKDRNAAAQLNPRSASGRLSPTLSARPGSTEDRGGRILNMGECLRQHRVFTGSLAHSFMRATFIRRPVCDISQGPRNRSVADKPIGGVYTCCSSAWGCGTVHSCWRVSVISSHGPMLTPKLSRTASSNSMSVALSQSDELPRTDTT